MRNFKLYELIDKETYNEQGARAWNLFNPEALIALDDLRDFFGVPITINNWFNGGSFQWRGFRTLEKAIELGAPHSQHAYGNAFDCDISGISAEDARKTIIEHKDGALLKRIMRLEGKVSWLHFDLMPVADRIHVFTV
jgi:hypothetical protein